MGTTNIFRGTASARAFVLLIALLCYGCDRGSSSRNSGAQMVEPVLLAQSDSSVEFSRVLAMEVDSHGKIYAGDQHGEIVVLNPEGNLVQRFGRMGGGPGEYQMVGPIRAFAGDSLFVFDPMAMRATIYAPGSDRVAYTIRFPEPNFSFARNVEPLSGGYIIAHFRRINGDVPSAGQRQDDLIRILNRDGSIRRDSVVAIREPEIVEVKNEHGQGFFFPPFARQTLTQWDAEGRVYTLWTDSSQVRIHDVNGRLAGEFTAALPGKRLPLAGSSIDSMAGENAGGGLTPRMLADAFRSRWTTWPLVEDMLVDDQSRIWIKPVSHDSIGDWLAFTPRGRQVASFRLPRTVTPRLIRGDRLYGVSRDSLDVESVVVYRLTPTSTRTAGRS